MKTKPIRFANSYRTPILASSLLLFLAFSTSAQELKVYFGNLHSHTGYSDGSGTPVDAYTHARDVAHLDFMAITEHNHAKQIKPKDREGDPIGKDHSLYNGGPDSLVRTAAGFTEDGRFIALYGQEFSTISSGNHANVFDTAEVIEAESGDYKDLIDTWLPTRPDSMSLPAILQFNHPSSSLRDIEYGRDDFGGDDKWLKAMSKHARLIEILNGPGLTKTDGHEPTNFESHYKYYLNLGFHLAPTGDQDNHFRTWGTLTDARTGIITTELTKNNLLQAMRSRHVYATEDKNLRFIAKITYPGMQAGTAFEQFGNIVETPPPVGTKLTITYSLVDDDESDAEYEIEIFSDTIGGEDRATVIAQHTQTGNTADNTPGIIQDIAYTGGEQYFYVRVQQSDEDENKSRLWTAPIWFGGSEDTAPQAPAADESQFVASKHSKIFHTDANCRDAQNISVPNRIIGHAATIGRTPHRGCPK